MQHTNISPHQYKIVRNEVLTLTGIFMGLIASFILLMILYVGISALASLQVTYAAFDKEQGALAQKKVS